MFIIELILVLFSFMLTIGKLNEYSLPTRDLADKQVRG